MRKIGLILGVLVVATFPVLPVVMAEDVAAEGEIISENKSLCDNNAIDDVLKQQAGCKEKKTAPSVIQALINVAISVIGIGAVAAMIYGGLMYTISTGDAGKTKRARDILIYGGVGLIVAILAFAIVSFVSTSIGGASSAEAESVSEE